MNDTPRTDALILPATEANYSNLLESHGQLERELAEALNALEDLYKVCSVSWEEDYYAVSNAAEVLDKYDRQEPLRTTVV